MEDQATNMPNEAMETGEKSCMCEECNCDPCICKKTEAGEGVETVSADAEAIEEKPAEEAAE